MPLLTLGSIALVMAIAVFTPVAPSVPDASWPQWGGARRNFMVESPPLAASWPASGPKKLWERSLGEGHSSIAVEGDRLYTMYRPLGLLSVVRRSQQEVIIAIDPSNGRTIWEHAYDSSTGDLNLTEGSGPHSTPLIVSTPVWGPGNVLFVSAAYNNGARALKLSRAEGKTTVRELWFQNRMRVHIGTVIALGDFAVGSSGDFGPCPTVAIDLASGAILWQNRDFARSTFLHADGKLIVLDEDGTLGLATATRQGFTVLTKAPILTNRAWTTPSLVGTKLFVRDRKQMKAFDLGR